MPQEIRDYRYDKKDSITRDSQPIISDTSDVKVRNSGPEAVKKVPRLKQDKDQFQLFTGSQDTEKDLEKFNNSDDDIRKKSQANDVSLLKVYVCDSNGSIFDPEKLVSSLNIAGLTYGGNGYISLLSRGQHNFRFQRCFNA